MNLLQIIIEKLERIETKINRLNLTVGARNPQITTPSTLKIKKLREEPYIEESKIGEN
jgi:hypothetical protein